MNIYGRWCKLVRDFYEILDIDKDASLDDIKKAYRKLAKKHHPDLNPDNPEAEQNFKEVTYAYEVLSNSEMRIRYDRYGHAGIDPQVGESNFGDFGNFGDIFGDIFDVFGDFGGFTSRSRRSARRNEPIRGSDLEQRVTIEFEEAVFGVEKQVQVRRYETCPSCEGSGAKQGTYKKTCSKCNGSGEVRYAQQTPFGQFVQVGVCDNCQGTGEIIEEHCETCHGEGKVIKTKTINVKIPAGVDNGSIMSIKGEGHSGERGGPSGDLYLYISVKEHPVFTRENLDLFVDVPVSYAQAILGSEIEVPTLEGIEKYDLPPGTDSHTNFKLKHKGVTNVRGLGKGDLYFTVKVIIPKDINEEQKEQLLKYSESMGEKYKAREKKGFFKKIKDIFN